MSLFTLFITFIISGLIINLMQLSLYFTLRYASKGLYRKINYYFTYFIQSQVVFILIWFTNSKLTIYMHKNDRLKYGKEHALFLGNHSYEVDWVMGWYFSEIFGALGNCKALIKKALLYVPVIGMSWELGGSVFLDRSFEKDRAKIFKKISELGDFPDPVWILLFPEGTRLTPAKLKASQEYAKKHNLPVLKHHLLPRTKGFVTVVQGMRDKFHVISSFHVAYAKNSKFAPTIDNVVQGNPLEAHLFCERILVDNLPKDEAGLTKWLYEYYARMDKIQDSFYNTGSFFKESGVTPIDSFVVKRRIWPMVNSIFWNTIIILPLLLHSILWIVNGGIFNAVIAILIILLSNRLMDFISNIFKIKHASGDSAK